MKVVFSVRTSSPSVTLLSVIFAILAFNLQAAFVVSESAPLSGPPGTEVTVTGLNFQPSPGYTVTLNGAGATAQNVADTSFTFTVPPGATSGKIEITDGTDAVTLGKPFKVTRLVSGTFTPPPGITLTGWSVSGGDDFGDVDGTGNFSVEVGTDEPTMVWVFRNPNEPAFMSLVVPQDATATVNSATTAASLVFLVPIIGSVPPATATSTWANILALAELSDLTALVNETAAGGYDYLNDVRVENARVSMVQQLTSTPPAPQGFKETTVGDAKLLDLFPDPHPHPVFVYDPVLESRLDFDSNNRRRQFLFSFNNLRDPSLDYVIDLFELDPSQFTNGFASVEALDGQDGYTFKNDIPWASGFVRAKLSGGKLDWFGAAYDAILGAITSPLEDALGLKPNVFEIPRNQDAVYAAHAYSGNLWYGLDKTVNGQENLLNEIDPNNQWTRTLAANVVIASIDLSSLFIDIKKLTGSEDAATIHSLVTGVYKSMLVYRADAGISSDEVYDLVKSIASSIVKTYVTGKAKDESLLAAAKRLGDRIAGTIASSLNVLKKVGTGLNVAERTFNLVSSKNLALERSVFIIGDPFAPNIINIEPRQGRTNTEVLIFGNNLFRFPEDGQPEQFPLVEFCTFQASAVDPNNAPVDKRLAAEVLEARPNRLRIRVPEGWTTTFNTNQAFICVTRLDSGNIGDSRPLLEAGKFLHLPPPEIFSTEPTPIVARSHFAIEGAYFTPDCEVFLDDVYKLTVLQVRTNRIQVASPNLTITGSRQLTVKSGGISSAPHPIDIGLPPRTPTSQTGGVSVTITKLDMSNTPDGEISILEALLIANGGLGRSIEVHDSCEFVSPDHPIYCGGPQQRETDFVAGDDLLGIGGGAGKRDIIRLDESLRGSLATISVPLPGIGSNDDFDFKDLTLDGSGAGGGGACLIFDGTLDSFVYNLIITNWPGDAILVVNGSAGNRLDDITIANATGDGLFISNLSTNNLITDFAIDNVGGTGIYLEGDSSANVFAKIVVNFPGQHGVHLENRCLLNDFHDITIQGSGMDGFRIEGASDNNELSMMGIATSTGAGLRIVGSKFIRMYSPATGIDDLDAVFHPKSNILDGQDWGIILENGAANNVLSAQVIGQNALGGILIHGTNTTENVFGRPYRADPAFSDPIFTMVADNMGPGIRMADGATRNSILCVNVAGNNGDGIQIDGEDTDDNRIKTVLTGFRFFIAESDPQPAPNQGNSITISGGADLNEITRQAFSRNSVSTSDDHFRNSLFLDTGNGIEISGDATLNQIDSTTIGSTFNVRTHFTSALEMAPVGKNGIVLTNGPNRTLVGSFSLKRDIHIDAVSEAAILLTGTGTDFNTILGVSVGNMEVFYDYANNPAGRSQYGIYIKDGPKGNQIGLPGPMDGQTQFGFGNRLVHSLNKFYYTKGAAVVFDNCGGSVNMDGERENPNVLQNNDIANNEIGLMLINNAMVNDIGGPLKFVPPRVFFQFDEFFTIQENLISASTKAGILIRNNVIPDEAHRNRFMNNSISTGIGLAFANSPVDPAIGPPSGVGILVDGSSSGNIIGENFGQLRNVVQNSPAGIYLNGVTNTLVRGFLLEGAFFSFPVRMTAGVIIRNGSNNQIGGSTPGLRNEISHWDLATSVEDNGIMLFGGSANRIFNNDILLNGENGIVISNSTQNLIGNGPGRPNRITENGANGILITGAGSTGNKIIGNSIGTDLSLADLGNTQSGILIENGASRNLIGVGGGTVMNGVAIPVPGQNVIAFNGSDGVRVVGASTLGNTIKNNSIFQNTLGGILNASGGNNELAPPIDVTFGGNSVSGSIANLGTTPPGSIVQIFSDSDDQGEILLGETTVRAGGGWSLAALPPIPLANINVNVTSTADGSTSEFTSVSVVRAFSLARTDGAAPGSRTISFAGVPAAVMSVRAVAVGGPVQVNSLTFTAEGTLVDNTELAEINIYRDVDGNAEISPSDFPLGSGATYDADNGTGTIDLGGVIVNPDENQEWLLAYASAGTVTQGKTFNARIENAVAVSASFQFPIGLAAIPEGAFPIRSDDFTVGQSVTHPVDAWRAIHFPGELNNPNISGYDANPDNDKIANLFEYLLGTDPNVADSDDGINFRLEGGRFIVEINRRTDATGVVLNAEASETLTSWLAGLPWLDATPTVTDLGNGIERVEFKTAADISTIDALMVRLKLELVSP